MNLECRFFNVKQFEFEITRRDRTTFTSYYKGKMFLPQLTQNLFFNALYNGLSSLVCPINNYQGNILKIFVAIIHRSL